MNKKRRFLRSEFAVNDLKEIADYGRKYFAKSQNQRFQSGLIKVFEMLRDKRYQLGTRRDEIKPNLLMFPYQHYNIYFYRTENEIILLRILRSDIDTLDPIYFQF